VCVCARVHAFKMPFTARTLQRLAREMKAEPGACDGCTLTPDDETMKTWSGTIQGPPGSPYEGGTFKLVLEIPDDYPFKPPKLNFVTPSACGGAALFPTARPSPTPAPAPPQTRSVPPQR